MNLKRESYQQGSLRKVKRSSGFVWEFRYRVFEDGKRKQKQITLQGNEYTSEAAVRRKLENFVLKLNKDATNEPSSNLVLGVVMDAFIETEMPERPKSRINYLLLLNRYIRPQWAEMRLSHLSPHAVERWLVSLPYAPETRRHIRNMLYRLFEFSMRKGWMEVQRNPIELVRVRGGSRTRETVILTPEQVAQIVSHLPDPYRLMVELATYLGLRISEVLGLQWDDIDEARKTLAISRSAVDGNVAETKTEASKDELPLSPEMLALLHRWKQRAPVSPGSWLFPSPVTGAPQHAGSLLKRHIKPIGMQIGVPSLGWHSFRHTYRSWLDAVGTPVGVQQRMMRHADVTTTMNIYGAALLESKRQAHGKILQFARVGLCGVSAVDKEEEKRIYA